MPILWLAGRMARKTMEQRQGLALAPGEQLLREIYVKTRDVRIRGFQWMGSGIEGKLVLTTYRLFYCFYDERSIAFAIEPEAVEKIELVPAHSFLPRPPKILLTARLPREASSRRLSFGIPGSASISEMAGFGMMRSVFYANPSTAADFVAELERWKSAGGARDRAAREETSRQRRAHAEAALSRDTRNAIVRLAIGLPCGVLTWIAPIFGGLALREARQLRAQAEIEGVAAPGGVAWVSRLGVVWIVVGAALWLLMVFVHFHGPLV